MSETRRVTGTQDQYWRFFKNAFDLALRRGWDRDRAFSAARRCARQWSGITLDECDPLLVDQVLYVAEGIVPEWTVEGAPRREGEALRNAIFATVRLSGKEEP